MMEGRSSGKKNVVPVHKDHGFTELVFSWSLEDIFNEDLYKYQVEKIPLSFQSEQQYLSSYVFPLLEETRAELSSCMETMGEAPFSEVISLEEDKLYGQMEYRITIDTWKNRSNNRGKEPYRTLPGDLVILVDRKPETVSDLQRTGTTWAFASVAKIVDEDGEVDGTSCFKIKASQTIEFHEGMKNSLFMVFLMNLTTSKRIWNSLHMRGNLNIIKQVLSTDSLVEKECNLCALYSNNQLTQRFDSFLSSKLNESQSEAVRSSLHKLECCHMSSVDLIWGPPGTGKTTTVSVMLFILLEMNHRTLACGPTNVSVTQIASRVLRLVKEFRSVSKDGESVCSFGDILLFGNKERLKVGEDIEEIYLENRVERLSECLAPLTGWRHCLSSVIDLLEDGVSAYHIFVENEKINAKKHNDKKELEKLEIKSFLEFVRHQLQATLLPLRKCIITFCTHLPRSYIGGDNFQNMVRLLEFLSSLELLLQQENLASRELEEIFALKEFKDDYFVSEDMLNLNDVRTMSLSVLQAVRSSLKSLKLPSVLNKSSISEFCFQRASLIFCTTSSSYKLHSVEMEPLNLLVIDEAAQLKESESTIPLQLPGMRDAILIGDECQLPAVVQSKVSSESGFGRSLFERLSSLGYFKHLLNVQYRMHPSISLFPNCTFYQNQILDAENVKSNSYKRHYLQGPMFSSYSFINVVGGKEERDIGHSLRNMVEVAVVMKIVQNLYRACKEFKEKISIGVVSPYAAQVASIQEKIGKKYENIDGFSVKVKSVDGFQGGEEDVIIISTVRSNSGGYIGFLSSPQRTNVALTRARYCLWILGNERTLASSESVWSKLVCDARSRHCLFDADADESLQKTIVDVKKELQQLDDLLDENSVLFKQAKWKVLFSDNFRTSFSKLNSSRMKKSVLNLLLKLASGWRPKNRNVDSRCESASQIMKQFKVEGLFVICTIDIVKEFKYVQVLKVWDILPLEAISKLAKRLDSIFAMYTDDFVNRCKAKCLDGDFEIPMSWLASQDLIRFRNVSNSEADQETSMDMSDGKNFVENSKVRESLLLMKFYSLSSGVVNHLLSDRDGTQLDLPIQVTDEQMDVILFQKSSFIIGRSGTGKTTVLTMKLFQNEQSFHVASEGFYAAESSRARHVEEVQSPDESKPTVLHQLFVTVSPRLCYAVKKHVSDLTSFARSGKSAVESTSIDFDDEDCITEFNDIPDSFVNIPEKKYPLVITFHKFLMMLDGTLGNSYFERFHEARELSHGTQRTSRSIALQTFIRLKEVTYDRFCSLYWPHFNAQLTKKFDPSRVFTEIISHVKGGLQTGETTDGKLSRQGYSLLSDSRASSLTGKEREVIYDLFIDYEKMKSERGEFDLGDLVNDLHRRLKNATYEGDQIDFVYIDEVQDLSMRQISLFKYICQNVDEGFIFAGDTAQTIARGIDFRFQDIRSLFYKEFISSDTVGRKQKGLVSEIFHLRQNFRTHSGVLGLAQSVIEIVYCYFPNSIDALEPETSLISGEAPVLLESGDNENAIITIFGSTASSGDIVGFGAEQVILVRDDSAKTEICQYVGKHALVLTIVECKGLEFQDVLLYNFFGSSPLKDHWRVIYAYMKEQDLLDGNLPKSFPIFSYTKHNVLCSELKQLYVAITRTRQRLWICENKEELSKPMFDYWKRRGLVQVRKLDDSVAQAMQVASSPQEWRERGIKLFYENNYVMATMCFERAGDMMWEKRAKASGLKASAEQMRFSNPDVAFSYIREAAKIFESIGKLESAAVCFCDLGEYARAGKIYLDKCGQLEKAAECFTLAKCYRDAAEVYAKGNHYSKCLSICKEGKFFDMGLQYIEYWKEHALDKNKEIEKIEQEFLENCALDYYEHKDRKSMMKFVRAFHIMDSKRKFLKSVDCLDELLLLEEESENFVEAAEIARCKGDVLKEADLLGKAGRYDEASSHILWYLFCRSLWGNGSKGWPPKHFAQKEKLCAKAKSFAMMDSDIFYRFVCNEIELLSDHQSSLSKLKKHLQTSQHHNSVRGEILSVRKILDAHLHLNSSKYDWEDNIPLDMNKHAEEKISQNRISLKTLIFYWNVWKENVMNILESLGSIEKEEPCKHQGHVDFILNYFGVKKQFVKRNMVYLLVIQDAEWVRKVDENAIQRNGEVGTLDARQLVSVSRFYWQSELISLGIKVLETLDALHKISRRSSPFHQSSSLLHIFEVSKFLLDCKHLNLTFHHTKTLQNFFQISTTYIDLVFPLDWRKSLTEDMISLRETDLSVNLLEEIILQNVHIKGDLSYWKVGILMRVWLGSQKTTIHYKKIISGLHWNFAWKSFAEDLSDDVDQANQKHVKTATKEASLICTFQRALEDTYMSNWRSPGYMSPHCFMYLLERLLIMTSLSLRFFFTMKSSFVEWFIHHHSVSFTRNFLPAADLHSEHTGSQFLFSQFVVNIVQRFLYNKEETKAWIRNCNIAPPYFYPLMVLKLFMILSIICLQFPDFSEILLDLLLRNDITSVLPGGFVYDLRRRRKGRYLNLNADAVAAAFIKVGDPLMIISLEHKSPKLNASGAIFVDKDVARSVEDIMRVLFPRKDITPHSQIASKNDDGGIISEAEFSNVASSANQDMNPEDKSNEHQSVNWKVFDEISEALTSSEIEDEGKTLSSLPGAAKIKGELDQNIDILTAACSKVDANCIFSSIIREENNVIEGLKQLSSAFDTRCDKQVYTISSVRELAMRLQISRPMIDDFLINGDKMKIVDAEASERLCMTEVQHEKKDQDDEEDSQDKVVSKNKGTESNQEAKGKKGKGNNKPKKAKKGGRRR